LYAMNGGGGEALGLRWHAVDGQLSST